MKTSLWFLFFGAAFFIGGIVAYNGFAFMFGVAGLLVGTVLAGQSRQHRQEAEEMERFRNLIDRM